MAEWSPIIAAWSPVIAAAVAVGGWLASHRLSLRAQEKQLQNQLLNQARLEVTEALRDGQDWTHRLNGAIGSARIDAGQEVEFARPVDWFHYCKLLADLVAQRPRASRWILRLEENLILFPHFQTLLPTLVRRQVEVNDFADLISRRLYESASTKEPPGARRRLLDDAWEKRSSILDHAVILEDVRVLLQNFALSRITGRKVPLRQPLEPNLPHVIEDKDGNLSIVLSQGQRGTTGT